MADHSPLDALEPMLATEGMENRTRGHEFVFSPFTLTPESVAPLRQRIIDIIFRELGSDDLRRSVRAADALQHALRYPHGYLGQSVDDDQREGWTPEFVATLERLARFVQDHELDPIVTIAIRRAIRWHANHSSTDSRAAARQVRDAIPQSAEHALALAMFDGWGHLADDDDGDAVRDYQRAQQARQERADRLAHELVDSMSDQEVLAKVEARLAVHAATSMSQAHPGPFVWTLIAARPTLGIAIAQAVATNPRSELLSVLGTSVGAITQLLPESSIPTIAALVASGDLAVQQQVAQGLGWNSGGRSILLDGELEILLELALDSDTMIRRAVVHAARRLAPIRTDAALTLLTSVPFADSTMVAEELFGTIGPQGGIDWRQLPDPQMDRFLAELALCPSIEDHSIIAFLADLSGERPDDLVRLLQHRVEYADKADGEYRALPFNWPVDLQVRATPQYAGILRRLFAWIAEDPGSWRRRDGGAEIFEAVAGTFGEVAMTILEDGVLTGDDREIKAAAAVLEKVPAGFAFDEVDFVRRILAAAAASSQEHLKRVSGALIAAASSGVRSGLAGQPFEEDVELRDRASELVELVPPGSPEERLYRSLQATATESIQWQTERDIDVLDTREW